MTLSTLTTSLAIFAVIVVAIGVIWRLLRGGEKMNTISDETYTNDLSKLSLNVHDGKLRFGTWQVSASDTTADLKNIIREQHLELIRTYSDWRTYRVVLSDKLIIGFFFCKEALLHVSLHLDDEKNGPFETNSKQAAERVLAHVGGEMQYSWGKVVLEVDKKGGSVSVILVYKQ